MKVWAQDWSTEQGYKISISKDKEQLAETIKRLKEKGNAKPIDSPMEVTIPDDHGLADIVEDDTIFLEKDEEDIIDYDS